MLLLVMLNNRVERKVCHAEIAYVVYRKFTMWIPAPSTGFYL